MSTRTRLTYSITRSAPDPPLPLHITDPSTITADNLALATWGSAEVLANTLHRLPPDLTDTDTNTNTLLPVLELGAGTGIAGLAAACLWKTNVVLTELPPLVPQLEANVRLNAEVVRACGGGAVSAVLDWRNPGEMVFGGMTAEEEGKGEEKGEEMGEGREGEGEVRERARARARVILAADTVYSEEHPGLLVEVVRARLERSGKGRVVFCYPLRLGYLELIRELWERMEGAGLVCVLEGRERVGEEWEEDVEYEWCVWRWGEEGDGVGRG